MKPTIKCRLTVEDEQMLMEVASFERVLEQGEDMGHVLQESAAELVRRVDAEWPSEAPERVIVGRRRLRLLGPPEGA